MTCIFRALFCVQCTNERTVFIHDNTRTWYIHVYAVVAAVYRWDIYVRYDLFFRDNLVPNLFIARIFLRTTCVAGIFCYVRPVGREIHTIRTCTTVRGHSSVIRAYTRSRKEAIIGVLRWGRREGTKRKESVCPTPVRKSTGGLQKSVADSLSRFMLRPTIVG